MEILQHLDINFILIIFLIFVLAGLIKGVIGVGLPTVSLALLSFILDIKESIAIVLIPIIRIEDFYLRH